MVVVGKPDALLFAHCTRSEIVFVILDFIQILSILAHLLQLPLPLILTNLIRQLPISPKLLLPPPLLLSPLTLQPPPLLNLIHQPLPIPIPHLSLPPFLFKIPLPHFLLALFDGVGDVLVFHAVAD